MQDQRAANLKRLKSVLSEHRQKDRPCENRFKNGIKYANTIASQLPLAWSQSTRSIETICRDGAIKSQAVRRSEKNLPKSVSSQTTEELLGTDRFVFLYAGPFRYRPARMALKSVNPGGFFFAVEAETKFTGDKVATPFDSGGLVKHFRPVFPNETIHNFLQAHEMPVPAYREYLAQFIATAFEEPAEYLKDSAHPACSEPVVVIGGDERAWTFEVRFEWQFSLEMPILAIFVPHVVAQEPWAKRIIAECKKKFPSFTWQGWKQPNFDSTDLLKKSSAFLESLFIGDRP